MQRFQAHLWGLGLSPKCSATSDAPAEVGVLKALYQVT